MRNNVSKFPMSDIVFCESGRVFCRANKIMLPVDGSEGSARAATVAFEVAELTQSKVFVIHVVPTSLVEQFAYISETKYDELLKKYNNKGHWLLKGYKEAAEEYGLEIETILEEGLPSERIIRSARKHEVDLIVVGAQGASGQKRAGMGSTTERVVLGAHCTVIVAK
ncbi:MAG: hypothetical protein BAJATHORv1_40012 [Candidatus Thorarchaeota archaeon]|nr:MAG: hypothetical protein BAJATHORv1_40012 [Candidatus Thorarchaeota archaeon]